jgi:nitroreductase
MTDVFDVITGRRTTKQLIEPGPTPEDIAQLVLAAECAPDYNELRPWRLVAIQGPALVALGEAFATSARPRAEAMGIDPEAMAAKARGKFARAPFVLAVIGTPRKHRKVRYEDQVASAAAAAQNVLLAATALGYGSIWRTDAEAEDDGVHAALGLDEGDLVVGFLHIGTIPDGEGSAPRLPRGDRVSFLLPA